MLRIRFWRCLFDYYVKNSELVGVLNSEELGKLEKIYGKKFVIVKNIINSDRFEKINVQREKGKIRLLFISRIIKEKGIFDFLRALKYVNKGAEVLIVGAGSALKKAEKLAKKLNLRKVKFIGYIKEEKTAEIYVNSDILVFPTCLAEGLPMAILNSLAAGLAIVTTKIKGAEDYLKEGENCLFVEAKKPRQLAERISYLMKNEKLRKKMRKNNIKLAELFKANRVVREFEAIYEKI